MFLLFLACRSYTEINPAAVTGTGYHLDRALADLAALSLRDCNGASESSTLYERFSLLQPAPIGISDMSWCGVDLDFRNSTAGGLSLYGSLLDPEGNPIQFSYLLAPTKVSLAQAFEGDGEELALVLDPDLLIDVTAIQAAAVEQQSSTLQWEASSAESATLLARLPSAFWVGTVSEAGQHFGARWVFGAEAFRRAARRETDGCGVEVHHDTGWDTGIYLGGTTTGGTTTGGSTTGGSDTDTGQHAESRRDSRALDSASGSSGCACGGLSADTGSTTGGTGSTADSSGESDASSSSSYCACGGGGGESAMRARPPASLAFLGVFWFQRRKGKGRRPIRRS